jgi:hypothetical protein
MTLARWLAPVALAAALGAGALFPAPAYAGEPDIRVIVDLGDVVFRNGYPYYRHGGYGYDDRLIVERDRRGRPVYYRYRPRDDDRYGPPYGNAWGHHRNRDHLTRNGFVRDPYGRYSRQRCDSRGRCRVEYYDPRYDQRYDQRNDYGYGYGRKRDRDRYWDGRRWRDRDD